MDAAKQALRFSIPGSVLLLLAVGLVIGGRALQGEFPAEFFGSLHGDAIVIVAALAAIPIGFLTYQVYYLSVRPFVWLRFYPWQRRWPRIDRGASVLSVFDVSQLDEIRMLYGLVLNDGFVQLPIVPTEMSAAEEEDLKDRQKRILDADSKGTVPVDRRDVLARAKPWKRPVRRLGGRLGMRVLDPEFLERWPGSDEGNKNAYRQAKEFYDKRWRLNWDILGAMVEAASEYPDTASLKQEYAILTDVYHALGACRTACAIAWWISVLVAAGFVALCHENFWLGLLAVIGGFLISLTIWLVLNQTRRQTWRAAQRMLRFGFKRLINRHPDFLSAQPAQSILSIAEGQGRLWRYGE